MPVTRVAIRQGKTSEYKRALIDEIYEATRESVAITDDDRFVAITGHGEDENWSFGLGETQFYEASGRRGAAA